MDSEAVAKEVMSGEVVTEQRDDAEQYSTDVVIDAPRMPSEQLQTAEEPTDLNGIMSDSPAAGVHAHSNSPEYIDNPGDAEELEEADDDDMLSELSEGVDFQVCILSESITSLEF